MNRKPYIQKQPSNWWVKNPFYRFYMLREATAIPLFLYSILLMAGVFALTKGEEAFISWVMAMKSPVMVLFHLIAFAAAMLHAYTFFDMVPKVMVIRLGDKQVPGSTLKALHWVAFAVCTVVLFIFAGMLF
ncbi:fumarate reductase subunit C [Gynuella sp.]|uniref:fumarate reductase subunit C n=1 Tax=Gynuella sp. TaxID=2969146 RepID=UPI003D1427E6